MKRLNEDTALSVLFANTRRKRRSVDLVTLGKNCDYLVELYGSRKHVAEKLGLSTEMIREFLTVLKLPKKVQKLVSERVIDSLDVVREISSIEDKDKQIAAAEALVNTSSKDVRDIKSLVARANLSVDEAKRVIYDAKPKGMHIFVVDFDDETYRGIVEKARISNTSPAELVRGVVIDWLKRKAGKGKRK